MLDQQVQAQRIAKLKQKKEELGWSCQLIADKVYDAGEIVSLGTVKRIFSANANDYHFKHATLLPIEKCLGLMQDVPSIPPETEEILREVIQEQRQQIVELRRQHEEDRAELRAEHRCNKNKTAAIIALFIYNSFFLLLDRFTVDVGWYRQDNPTGWFVKAFFLAAFAGAILFVHIKTKLRRNKSNGEK